MRALFVLLTSVTLAAQTYPPPFPRDGATKLLENDRVVVWDVVWPKGHPTAMHRHPYVLTGVFIADGTRVITREDGVKQDSVTKKGDVVYVPRHIVHIEEGTSDSPTHAILVELKEDAASGQVEASGDPPPAFPREGAKALVDNPRVTLWEYQWKAGSKIPLHRHTRDALVVWLENGTIRSIPQTGEPGTIEAAFGQIRWGARGTVHSEEVVAGSPRGVVIELK